MRSKEQLTKRLLFLFLLCSLLFFFQGHWRLFCKLHDAEMNGDILSATCEWDGRSERSSIDVSLCHGEGLEVGFVHGSVSLFCGGPIVPDGPWRNDCRFDQVLTPAGDLSGGVLVCLI